MVNRTPVFSKPEVKKAIAAIRDALREALPEASFGEREAHALAISDEAVRGLLQEDLQALADGFGDEVLVDGAPHKLHEPGTDTYHSLCGPLEVSRPSYRRIGMHNGPIVIALELAAGLVEGATPALAYSVVHGYPERWNQRDRRRSRYPSGLSVRTPSLKLRGIGRARILSVRYDFAAFDRAGKLTVVVEVKRRTKTSAEWAKHFRRNLMAHGTPPPGELFAIVAPDKIYTWRARAAIEAGPDAEIDARAILGPYFERSKAEPERIDPGAFELLVAWWLEDVAREGTADARLKASGLPEALAGGRIAREVAA
jgi:hypothetical protein